MLAGLDRCSSGTRRDRLDREGLLAWARNRFGTDGNVQDLKGLPREELRAALVARSSLFHHHGKQLLAEARSRLGQVPAPQPARGPAADPDRDREALPALCAWLNEQLHVELAAEELRRLDRRDLELKVLDAVEERLRPEMRRRERSLLLEIVDRAWRDHLLAMDRLRSSVGSAGSAQVDPTVAYKREGLRLFEAMQETLDARVTDLVFRLEQLDESCAGRTPLDPRSARSATHPYDFVQPSQRITLMPKPSAVPDPNLSVSLYDLQVTEEALARLPEQLHSLALYGKRVTDESLPHLSRLTALASLSLVESWVTDAGLQDLQPLAQLKFLSLAGSAITDAGLEKLRSLAQLEVLNLSETHITDEGLACLKELPRLRELRLSGTGITGRGFKDPRQLSGLRELVLQRCNLTDDGLREIAALEKIQTLELQSNHGLSDDGVACLQQHKGLQKLYLYDTDVSDEAIRRLQRSLPKTAKVFYSPTERFDAAACWAALEQEIQNAPQDIELLLRRCALELSERAAIKLTLFMTQDKPSYCVQLLRALRDDQFAAVEGRISGRDLVTWHYLALERGGEILDRAVERLPQVDVSLHVKDDEQAAGAAAEPLPQQLEEVQRQIRDFLEGRGDPAHDLATLTRRLAQLSAQAPARLDPATVGAIAGNLANFTFEGLVFAVPLLAGDPQPEWHDELRRVWFRLEDSAVRNEHSQKGMNHRTRPLPPAVELAAHSVAAAWAACAAKDPDYGQLDLDQRWADTYAEKASTLMGYIKQDRALAEDVRQIDRRLKELEENEPQEGQADDKGPRVARRLEKGPRRRRQRGGVRPSKTLDELKNDKREKEEFRYRLARNIQDELERLGLDFRYLRGQLSAAYALQRVVRDEQHFPVGLRQAAVTGIERLIRESHLHEDVKADLQGAAVEALSSGDPRMRERRVCLMPHATPRELHQSLRAGCDWMAATQRLLQSAKDRTAAPALRLPVDTRNGGWRP